jgi:hypothetical protein
VLLKARFGSGWWACLLAIPLAQAAPAAKDAPSVSATDESTAWVSHDVSVRLEFLPHRYSCDDLQDRVHDLLAALGARQDMKIGVSECERRGEEYTPRVRVQFATPSALLTSHVVTSAATPHTLRLAPGHLGSWTRDDCELMRQLKNQLLTQLPANKVLAYSLACGAPINSERYSVIVQATEPAHDPSHVAVADVKSASKVR